MGIASEKFIPLQPLTADSVSAKELGQFFKDYQVPQTAQEVLGTEDVDRLKNLNDVLAKAFGILKRSSNQNAEGSAVLLSQVNDLKAKVEAKLKSVPVKNRM